MPGRRFRVLHTQVGAFPNGHVFSESDLPVGADIDRLLNLKAVEETTDPRTGEPPLGPETRGLPPKEAPSDDAGASLEEGAEAAEGEAGETAESDASEEGSESAENEEPIADEATSPSENLTGGGAARKVRVRRGR